MLKQLFFISAIIFSSVAFSQEMKKIKVIDRTVEGEIRGLYGDTLYGKITVEGSTDYYITSITFKQKGRKSIRYSAEDIKRFRMVVPFPDRPTFGVEEVYYETGTDPNDKYKKVFLPIEEWK